MTQQRQLIAQRATAIQQSYMRLWTAFQDAANAQKLSAEALDTRGAIVVVRDAAPTATAHFLLKGWPFKAVSAKRTVDVLVRVTETFSDDLEKVTHATTCVGYFLVKGEQSSRAPLLELHYDFETPVREAHPIFHAQLGSTKWDEGSLQKLGFVGKVEGADADSYANARIPTAFMGFGPILVMLAADHLLHTGYRSMVRALTEEAQACANPECELLSQGLLGVGVPHARHWYDPRYVVHTWSDRKRSHRARVPVLNEDFSHNDPKKLRVEVAKRLGVKLADLHFKDGQP